MVSTAALIILTFVLIVRNENNANNITAITIRKMNT
jgi:hypothetical protein